MTLHGIDISHYQAGLNLAKTGAAFAIMKATEGTSYVDPYCDRFYTAAKKAGMLRGVYHFYRGNPTTEADHFLRNIKGYLGDALLALDFEDQAHAHDVAGALTWLDRVHAKTGIKPVIYMSHSFLTGANWNRVRDADYGLWLARYNTETGPITPWNSLTLWQYTSSHHTAGYTVDADHFYGTRDAWDAYASGGHPDPTPTPDTGGKDTPVDYWHDDPDDPHYHETQGDPIEEAKLKLKEAKANAEAKPNPEKADALGRHLQAIRTDPDLPWWHQNG